MAYQKIKSTKEYNPNKLWELTEDQATQLAREIWDDPTNLGYDGKNSSQIEALINERTVLNAEETVLVETVEPHQVRDAIPYQEYAEWKRRGPEATWWFKACNKQEHQALRLLWSVWEEMQQLDRPISTQSDHFRELRQTLRDARVISSDTYHRLDALTTIRRPVPYELKQFQPSRTDVLLGTAVPWSSFIHVTAADIELIWQQKGRERPAIKDILNSFKR